MSVTENKEKNKPGLLGAVDQESKFGGLLEGQCPLQTFLSDKCPYVPSDIESTDGDV